MLTAVALVGVVAFVVALWALFRGAAALEEAGPEASSGVAVCHGCGAAVTAWHTYPDGTTRCSGCRRLASR